MHVEVYIPGEDTIAVLLLYELSQRIQSNTQVLANDWMIELT